MTPQACYVCHEIIRSKNSENVVLCCQICGVAVHHQCMKQSRSDCKRCVSKGSSSVSKGGAAIDAPKHHFVITCSAAEPEKFCLVCKELCGGVGMRAILRCVWCQEVAHLDCIMEQRAKRSPVDTIKMPRSASTGRFFRVASENGLHKRLLNGTSNSTDNAHRRSDSLDNGTESTRPPQQQNGHGPGLNGVHDTSESSITSTSTVGGGTLATTAQSSLTLLDTTTSSIWASSTCSMGRHNRLVIPPHAMAVSAEADRRFQLGWGRASKLERQLTPISLTLYRPNNKFHSGQYWIESGGITFSDLPAGSRPLLVFINPASGPREGEDMVRRLRAVLNPLQVVVLSKTQGPEMALSLFKGVSNLRVLVCGGDGTIGWVLSSITSIFGYNGTMPPVAVWPMGTGNDLARCLGWSNNARFLRGRDGLAQGLADVQAAALTLLDRWRVTFYRKSATGAATSTSRPDTVKEMNNYLGIGIDAKVTLEFHSLRESYPDWFHSQMGNKLWYTGVGARGMIWTKLDLQSHLSLECDGEQVDLPSDIQGILILNVGSYMGGVDVWAGSAGGNDAENESDTLFSPQRMNDGWIEVVGVGGPFHLGQMQVGLSHAQRLRQCSKLQVTIHKPIPVQIDGEPWQQDPCTLTVEHAGEVTMLRRLSKNKPKDQSSHVPAALAEVLEEAHYTGMISSEARAGILAELIRRVEGDG